MTPALRKLALTAHVIFSVAWPGAVAAFLTLSIAGVTSAEADVVRAAYHAMNLISLFVIVPLSLAALASGLLLAFATEWGLLRYYWVFVKFLLTVFATIALLLHQFTAVDKAANLVAGPAAAFPSPELSQVGMQLVADSSLGILLLLTATTLAIYKPWGLTRYGRRKRETRLKVPQQCVAEGTGDRANFGLTIFLTVVGLLVAAFAVLHLTGRGLGSHGH